MSIQPLDEEAIFRVARKIESREARSEYLQQVCGEDRAVHERVRALLQVHDQEPSFLELPHSAVSATVDFPPITERPGTQIGPYELVEEIGSGGMGVVYMALQRDPVRRKVALKIIKPGMDTREVIGRFKAEEQALAVMDHPNIAKVHDAGATESGRPYFVMELVNGVPITEYCDDNKLATRQRLELFVSVCNAVQHAHQKGVIHRDIKPSNILVTLHDGVPVPKIIDFGIAKAINQELAASTVVTGFGQMIGTPMYMSPEQAERSGMDVDTRSDIYSLGVLLYELLTGTTPFDKEQLQEAGFDELRRLIREQDPERPSTRISTLGKAATTMSEHRSTSPAELSNTLRQELDWIAMKALDKDRTQRYETAADLVRDIQRYLNDEPVEACPPSTLYRLRKLARRNRVAVLATSAVALALILGAAVAGGQAYRATKAEGLAKKQQQLAEEAAERERDLRTEAESARKQAEQVTEFLVEIFRSPDPARDGRTITVAEMLDQAKTRVQVEFKDDPVVQGKLLVAIGATYDSLGLYNAALELLKPTHEDLKQTLGLDDPLTLLAASKLAWAYSVRRMRPQAVSLCEDNLQRLEALLGKEHPRTIQEMVNLGIYLFGDSPADGMKKFEEALVLARSNTPPDNQTLRSCLHALAIAYHGTGRSKDALPLCQELLDLSKQVMDERHASHLNYLQTLACCYHGLGRLDECVERQEQLVSLHKQVYGPDHPRTLNAMGNLAGFYNSAGRYDDAVSLGSETLRLKKEVHGPKNPGTLITMNVLAMSYHYKGLWNDALSLATETLRLQKEVLGPEHPDTLSTMGNSAIARLKLGQLDEAIVLLEEVLRVRKNKLRPEHPKTLKSMGNVASAYLEKGRRDEAISLLVEVLRLTKETHGPDHPSTLAAMNGLAVAWRRKGLLDEATALYEEAARHGRQNLGPNHPHTQIYLDNLACAYLRQDRLAEAMSLFKEVDELQKDNQGAEHEYRLSFQVSLGWAYHRCGELDAALPILQDTRDARRKELGAEHPSTLNSNSILADAYRDAGKVDEAVDLLQHTRTLQEKVRGPDHSDTLTTMHRLAKAYAEELRLDEARQLLEETVRLRTAKLGPQHYDTLKSMASLACVLRDAGEKDKAREQFQIATQGLEEALGPTHSTTINCMVEFAKLHSGQEEFDEAERLLLAAERAKAQKAPSATTPRDRQQMRTILTDLVKLYESTNQSKKAASWRKKLEAAEAQKKEE